MTFAPTAAAAEPQVKIDPTKAKMTAQLKHANPLIGCRFDPSGKYVFAGSQDNSIVRWEISSSKATELKGHRSWVRALAFAAKEQLLFSGDWAGRLLAWPVAADAPTPVLDLDAHRGWVRALAVSPDGQTLASCGNDRLVKLWSIPDGRLIREFTGHESHVYNVAFHPDGKFLASADHKGNVFVWDLGSNQKVRSMEAKMLVKYDTTFGADIGGIRSMAFDSAGKYLACAGITNVTNAFAGIGNPLVVLFDWETGKIKGQMKPKAVFQGMAWGVVFHPQGDLLGVAGGNGGQLYAWKVDKPEAYHMLALPNNARDLALHPDGKTLAIPFFDGVLRLYTIAG